MQKIYFLLFKSDKMSVLIQLKGSFSIWQEKRTLMGRQGVVSPDSNTSARGKNPRSAPH